MIRQETWLPVGVAHFSLYIYSKMFKNLLVFS